MDDSLANDKLHKLAEEFHKFVSGIQEDKVEEDYTIGKISNLFGLSISQAKAWLEKEPNYLPADESLQRNKADKDFTEPV